MFANGDLQRPSQHTTVNQLFDLGDSRIHTVESIRVTEPGIQSENRTILFNSLTHTFTLANRTGHRFFTPNIFTGFGCINRHNAMPMRRSGNMNNIHIGVIDQITIIVISRNLFPGQLQASIYVRLVNITNGHQTCSSITKMVASHTSDADDTFGQLITRCSVTRTSEHVTWHDCQSQRPEQALFQKFSPFHLLKIQKLLNQKNKNIQAIQDVSDS